jgi:hypothetical protein
MASDVRLTNAACITSSYDRAITAAEIFYMLHGMIAVTGIMKYTIASGDGGINWSPDARMTNNSASKGNPSIWYRPRCSSCLQDERNGNAEIYYKRSVNGGFSWSSDTRLTIIPAAPVSLQ